MIVMMLHYYCEQCQPFIIPPIHDLPVSYFQIFCPILLAHLHLDTSVSHFFVSPIDPRMETLDYQL